MKMLLCIGVHMKLRVNVKNQEFIVIIDSIIIYFNTLCYDVELFPLFLKFLHQIIRYVNRFMSMLTSSKRCRIAVIIF